MFRPLDKPLITVVETGIFLRRAEGLLSVLQRAEVVNFASANPGAGDLIQGTGGLRFVGRPKAKERAAVSA